MEKIQEVIYSFLVMVLLTLFVLMSSYNRTEHKKNNTTETVSIELNKEVKSI